MPNDSKSVFRSTRKVYPPNLITTSSCRTKFPSQPNDNSNSKNLQMQIYNPLQTPLNNGNPETIQTDSLINETVDPQNPIPKLWKINPSITSQNFGGTCKPPKHILGKWDGEVATYPDYISNFNEFIHKLVDIMVPKRFKFLNPLYSQKLQRNFAYLIELTLPKMRNPCLKQFAHTFPFDNCRTDMEPLQLLIQHLFHPLWT